MDDHSTPASHPNVAAAAGAPASHHNAGAALGAPVSHPSVAALRGTPASHPSAGAALGAPATVRLGEGRAQALSPDGRFALTLGTQDLSRFRLVPLGEGKASELPATGLQYQWARFFPDGTRLLTLANEPDRPLRLYVQPLDGKPFPITPPTVTRNVAISPDGANVALLSADGNLVIYPAAEGGTARVIPTSEPMAPLLWAEDDCLYVQHVGAYTQIPTRISRLHLSTGRLEPWQDVVPSDSIGVNAITKVMLSQDARTLVFNYRRALSDLFVVEPSTR